MVEEINGVPKREKNSIESNKIWQGCELRRGPVQQGAVSCEKPEGSWHLQGLKSYLQRKLLSLERKKNYTNHSTKYSLHWGFAKKMMVGTFGERRNPREKNPQYASEKKT